MTTLSEQGQQLVTNLEEHLGTVANAQVFEIIRLYFKHYLAWLGLIARNAEYARVTKRINYRRSKLHTR
jgi:hypothetical protein